MILPKVDPTSYIIYPCPEVGFATITRVGQQPAHVGNGVIVTLRLYLRAEPDQTLCRDLQFGHVVLGKTLRGHWGIALPPGSDLHVKGHISRSEKYVRPRWEDAEKAAAVAAQRILIDLDVRLAKRRKALADA